MGWCSGTEIFDDVTGMVIDQDLENDEKRGIIKRLVMSLENGDWDCQSDSEYYDHPLVQSVFKELHPDWFEEDVIKLKAERNELARLAYVYVKDYQIDGNDEFIRKYENGYYK